jgi:G:T/U-mismatch repair DNA glycosylase
MRFEELAYAEGGLPATVRFDAPLTIVRLPEEERAAWVARLLGVLEGTRAGDGTSVIYLDGRGRRIGLDRDDRGSATLIDLATGAEVPYSAGSLSLDGRFDWFASIGLTSRAASDLIVVGPAVFTADEKYDPQEIETKLKAARGRLTRVAKQHQSALARSLRRDDLGRRIAELDDQIEQAEVARVRREAEAEGVRAAAGAADDWWEAMRAVDDGRRAFGSGARLDQDALVRALVGPIETPDDLESLAKACRVVAERRDELVNRLDSGATTEVDESRRELIEEVEPAFVDALAALAGACRPFDVTIDAARIGTAGIGAAGIETMTTEVLSEVAAHVAEARQARLQQALEEAEAECRTARERLEHNLIELGLPTGSAEDLVAGAESVAARANEADNPSVAATRRAIAERTKLTQALHRVERNLPDIAELTEKHSALEEEVAALGAALSAGRPLLSAQEAEMFLLRRAGEAGEDRRREPLPLVVNDALAPFGTSDKLRLLDVVARLTETTQVVYLTDDPDTLAWASDRAADDAPPFTSSGYGGST